jgi:cobalt/nickel transport system permease protein
VHISEGILSAPVLIGGAALAAGGVALGLRKMDYEKIPEVAVMTSAFFVASLVRVPLGPGSVHLTLNGLMGLLLGWMSFPAMLVALGLQAVLFQFGGLTTLGVNTLNMAAPAVAAHYLLRPLVLGGSRSAATVAGFLAGALGIVGAAALMALSLTTTGEEFSAVAKALLVANVPVAAAEGVVTAFVVVFLVKVKPELIYNSHPKDSHQHQEGR